MTCLGAFALGCMWVTLGLTAWTIRERYVRSKK